MSDCRSISLPRFARLLSLGLIGLAGFLSLAVGGIVLVKGHVFRVSNVQIRERTGATRAVNSPAGAYAGSGSAASGAAARNASADASAVAARRRRALAQSDPAPRRIAWIPKNQPEAPETVNAEAVPAAHAE